MSETRQQTVVCVDDERLVLAALRRALRCAPYEVLATDRPEQVLEWVETRDVDLVIADERMPAMAGSSLLREVEQRSPRTRRLALTAFPDSAEVRRAVGREIERVVPKPWDTAELRRIIDEMLRHDLSRGAGDLRLRLLRVAYMMLRDRWLAEDVTQDTLALAMEHLPEFRGEGDLFSWAYTIALNRCREHLRAIARRPAAVDPQALDQRAAGHRGPITTAILREEDCRLAEAIGCLDPTLRETFILHYVEGLPYVEVASICGTTPAAARQRAARARAELRRTLGMP